MHFQCEEENDMRYEARIKLEQKSHGPLLTSQIRSEYEVKEKEKHDN